MSSWIAMLSHSVHNANRFVIWGSLRNILIYGILIHLTVIYSNVIAALIAVNCVPDKPGAKAFVSPNLVVMSCYSHIFSFESLNNRRPFTNCYFMHTGLIIK